MLLTAPACGSTVAATSVNTSSFTLAFDAESGCFKIGTGAPCDSTKGGQCCASAPKPPKFSHILIKLSSGSACATKTELKNIK
ncbi:hypothetical protein Rsub_11354 [Raphidocelis subcapitata]|uniref:Uncharacterized protein n=1 Tax=Raphidocelis subcapitata TaxID=307507 RepID=A0A2V0PD94_9CHLO|nr:hypothetical protein Rsub_11354 [Raphidocelis subcapitata]|eukprot:GBF97828.1 hypothetical protein Rsub_11354 [Raphidocelis subcapitata]